VLIICVLPAVAQEVDNVGMRIIIRILKVLVHLSGSACTIVFGLKDLLLFLRQSTVCLKKELIFIKGRNKKRL
jgi:hypothetical protein